MCGDDSPPPPAGVSPSLAEAHSLPAVLSSVGPAASPVTGTAPHDGTIGCEGCCGLNPRGAGGPQHKHSPGEGGLSTPGRQKRSQRTPPGPSPRSRRRRGTCHAYASSPLSISMSISSVSAARDKMSAISASSSFLRTCWTRSSCFLSNKPTGDARQRASDGDIKFISRSESRLFGEPGRRCFCTERRWQCPRRTEPPRAPREEGSVRIRVIPMKGD